MTASKHWFVSSWRSPQQHTSRPFTDSPEIERNDIKKETKIHPSIRLASTASFQTDIQTSNKQRSRIPSQCTCSKIKDAVRILRSKSLLQNAPISTNQKWQSFLEYSDVGIMSCRWQFATTCDSSYVLQSSTPYWKSITLYYKVLLQYYSVLQSTNPLLLCTTKY